MNGNAEEGPCQLVDGVTHPTGWNYDGLITQMAYDANSGVLNSIDPGPM